MICCMPSTSSLLKSLQQPVRTWLSNTSQRALRLNGSSRTTSAPRFGGTSQSSLKGSVESTQDAIYCHPLPKERHSAWAGADTASYPLRSVKSSNDGVWKKTEIEISRAGPISLGSNTSKGSPGLVRVVADEFGHSRRERDEVENWDLDSLCVQE